MKEMEYEIILLERKTFVTNNSNNHLVVIDIEIVFYKTLDPIWRQKHY